MPRRILLVDDEVAVLLTMKAILEISGFEVDTAASAREGKSKLRIGEYHMVITDMRMENDAAGREVILAARMAQYHPAVALLTAFPVDEEDWQEMGAHQLLLKPMHTRVLLQQIEQLFASHAAKLARLSAASAPQNPPAAPAPKKAKAKKVAAKSATRSKPAKKAVKTPKTTAKKTAKQTKKTAKKAAKKK